MKLYKQYIMKYMQIYDPGYFNMIYALKAMVAISLSVLFNFWIFGSEVIIWAGMTPMQVFFLNTSLSQQANRKIYTLAFAVCSSFAVGFFTILAKKALASHNVLDVWWLAIPVLFFSFIVGMSRAYSLDVYRMFIPVVINSLVACIYVDSGVFVPIEKSMFVVFNGALFGIIIGFILLNSSSNYGKYTRVYYPSVLKSLNNMIRNLNSTREFNRYKDSTFIMINNIKQTLHTKSNIYNDNYMIKNIKRAIFYIYRIEDIYLMINVLKEYKIYHKYPLLQHEIIENIDSLSRIFAGRIPNIKRSQADKIINSNDDLINKELVNVIKILYYKLESFCRVGRNADPAFNPPAKKSLKDVFKALNHKNPTFRFSVKYSLAICLSLVFATLLNINRGIWISLGVVSVVRPSVGGMQNIGKEYFISASVGIFIGIIVSVFASPIIFYALFVLMVFLIVYLRVFPFWLWSGFMMCGFVMMYSIIYEDFLHYVIDRLLDIGVGVIFAITIFMLIWPRFSHTNLKPILVKEAKNLKDIFGILKLKKGDSAMQDRDLQIKHADCLRNLDELKNTLKDSQSEREAKTNQIVVYGMELVNVLESIMLRVNELMQLCFSYEQDNLTDSHNNDLKIIETRFDMIANLLENIPHFFSLDENNRFLSNTDEHFGRLIKEIFMFQNELYKLLDENHISAPQAG